MDFKKSSAMLIAAVAMASMCFADLSKNDASLVMGKTWVPDKGGVRASVRYAAPSEWNKNQEYKGSWEIGEGDTVWYGNFNGKRLYWWAKFAADSSMIPGETAAEGGTSPWVLINSLSALQSGGRPNFRAVTWNGENNSDGLNSIGSGQAKVPTWRDAANGAYSITLDDIGSMPFDLTVRPGWELTQQYPDIKMSWGVIAGKMSDADWKSAIAMVIDGNEMFNHSMDHTSAADQWQIYYPDQTVSETDPAVPASVRGLTVVGTWTISSKSSNGKSFGPFNLNSWNGNASQIDRNATSNTGNPVLNEATANGGFDDWVEGAGNPTFTLTAESELVTITMPAYWTGYDPQTNIPWNDSRITITPKSGVETIELAGGQKAYVKYDAGYPQYTSGDVGYNRGKIAATGVSWYEVGKLLSDFPFYYNGLYVKTDWTTPGCEASGCDKSGTPGRLVTELDQGRPGFVAKLFCIRGWDNASGNGGPQTRRNVDTANILINNNIYANITTAGEYFAKGKRSEYFAYPFDAYSEKTHDYLYQGVTAAGAGKFAGARGGAKSGKPMPGDFFHPFRIDFDAFYINDRNWTAQNSAQEEFIYPNNPHVLLGINELVDEVVKANGYMVRELHGVADLKGNSWYSNEVSDLWPINNSGLGQGGWWGGITKDQLGDHFNHIQGLIDQRKLTVFTPSEAVKYRMTANAFNTDASLAANGQNWKVQLSLKPNESVDEVHREEISVIVNLGEAVNQLSVAYDGNPTNTSSDNSPRRKPRKMDSEGKIWSVSINPFVSGDYSALLVRDGVWYGQGDEYDDNPGSFDKPSSVSNVSKKTVRMSFAGIRNGQIALNLRAGNYTAELYNLQGRLIGSVNINAFDGVNITGLRTNNIAKGLVILNVKQAGASVLQHKIMIK